MARGTANTRMRDFYDIHVICQQKSFDPVTLRSAFLATSDKRGTVDLISDFNGILDIVESDDVMRRQWENFQKESFFIGELSWAEVMESVKNLVKSMMKPRVEMDTLPITVRCGITSLIS